MTLQELLGIGFPIIQAPMAGVQGSALAIAVSNAGARLARAYCPPGVGVNGGGRIVLDDPVD